MLSPILRPRVWNVTSHKCWETNVPTLACARLLPANLWSCVSSAAPRADMTGSKLAVNPWVPWPKS